jgi:hypothetical protein
MIIRIGKLRIGFATVKDKSLLKLLMEQGSMDGAADLICVWNKHITRAEARIITERMYKRWKIVPDDCDAMYDDFPDDSEFDGFDDDPYDLSLEDPDDFDGFDGPDDDLPMSVEEMEQVAERLVTMGIVPPLECTDEEQSGPEVDSDIKQTDPEAVKKILDPYDTAVKYEHAELAEEMKKVARGE